MSREPEPADDQDRHDHPDHGHGRAHSNSHSHAQAHTHHHAPASFDRAFGIAIALNLGFVAVEAFYGWRVDSLALLADAGHMLTDATGVAIALIPVMAIRDSA